MDTVRVTSGKYRGQILATPGGKTHPMGAREKLALFNMIVDYLPGATVLDAFAGSGALGIEALSRGAAEVVFVEKDARACATIRDNLAKLGLDGEVLTTKIESYETSTSFDVVLADPPYDDYQPEVIDSLVALLKEGGILVLSHPGEPPVLQGLQLIKSRNYAGATISLFVKSA